MIWANWSDFFAMGGYALYVWGSFIVVFAGLAAEVLLLRQQTRALRAQFLNQRAASAARARKQT